MIDYPEFEFDMCVLELFGEAGPEGVSKEEAINALAARFGIEVDESAIEASTERLIARGLIERQMTESELKGEIERLPDDGIAQSRKIDALLTQAVIDDAVYQAKREKFMAMTDEYERIHRRDHAHVSEELLAAARNVYAAIHESALYVEAITTNPQLGFPRSVS